MKYFSKVVNFFLLGVLLSSCGLMDLGSTGGYSGYEEYFEKEKNYKKYTDMDSLNEEIRNTAYFWSMYEGSGYTAYYTGKNDLIMIYEDKPLISLRFTDGKSVTIQEKDNIIIFETDEVSIDNEGNKNVMIEGKDSSLNLAKDDEGYLLVAYEKHMFYVTKDLKTFYVNETNTNVFQGYNDTKTIVSSDLLNNTLNALGNEKRLELPAPKDNYEIWYGMEYYNEKPSHGTAYIADIKPEEYVEILKDNGYTVIRSYEDPFYAFYGEDGGYWYCYDEQEEMKLIVHLTYYLYINDRGESFGPHSNTVIDFYQMNTGYFGEKERTTNEAWTSYDLENMKEWYDGTIDGSVVPFIPLGSEYYVPAFKSSARSNSLDGSLMYHHECYNITDGSNRYYLDGYDEILEANGFHKYIPSYDLSNPDEKSEFFNTEESKYVNCFINQEKDIAIKYYFDIHNGNTIRVFKLSEMKSWLTDLED